MKFWSVINMLCLPHQDGMDDVVYKINTYRRYIVEHNNREYIAEWVGEYLCPLPSQEGFIPYKDLTKEIISGWLDTGMPVADIDLILEADMQKQLNPSIIELPLPWSNNN